MVSRPTNFTLFLSLIFLDDTGATSSRPLGLLVARGTLLTSIAPVDGSEEIANPFADLAADDA